MKKIFRLLIPLSLLFSQAKAFPLDMSQNSSIQIQDQKLLKSKYKKTMKKLINAQNEIARFGEDFHEVLSERQKIEINNLSQSLIVHYFTLHRINNALEVPNLHFLLEQTISKAEIDIQKSKEFLKYPDYFYSTDSF